MLIYIMFFFKQKTAYDMRISDWSSDVCSSDLNDPLGAGYHITQSKIAFGSGGVFGKGFMQGTQSHLNFLPERQTDFIFTMLAEELGMVGGLVVLGLFVLLFIYGFAIALRSRNHFEIGRASGRERVCQYV